MKRNSFGISKNAEIIDLGGKIEKNLVGLNSKGKEVFGREKEARERADYEKRCAVDKGNSYATERILKANFEKEWRANPGLRSEIVRKYQKKG